MSILKRARRVLVSGRAAPRRRHSRRADLFGEPLERRRLLSTDATFDQEYGLSAPPSFTVDNLGATTTDAGWALETSLDVEWAHAIAPQANIILVEAATSSLSSLFSAVSFAGKQAGLTVVSRKS
jgi:hypothetical protein